MANTWHSEIEPFNFGQYKNIDLDRLTVYAIKFLRDRKIEPTFENIVVALYKMFPESFSLVGFHEYPDSNRVNRQLLHCRPKYRGYLIGGMRRGWILTEKGLAAAEEAQEFLRNPSLLGDRQRKQPRTTKERTKSVHFVNEILRSEAYEKYNKGMLDQIADIELCNVLHANLDTPKPILVKSLQKLETYAKTVGNRGVIRFLEYAKQRLVAS